MQRILLTVAALTAIVNSAPAQVGIDSAGITGAWVRFVTSHPAAAGEAKDVSGVLVGSGTTPWGIAAATALRLAIPASTTPLPDSIKYYAIRVQPDSVRVVDDKATVWATWSECIQSRLGQGMNWWAHRIAYALARTDAGWIATEQHVEMFLDGKCTAYRARPQ